MLHFAEITLKTDLSYFLDEEIAQSTRATGVMTEIQLVEMAAH